MNSSDETKRAIRALRILGFQFPPDKKRTQEIFEQLDYEHLLAISRVYKEEFEFFMRSMDYVINRVVETYCHICDRKEYSYDDIPEYWGWYNAQSQWYLMCDDCQYRYAEKFNKLPEVVREPPQFGVEADNQ